MSVDHDMIFACPHVNGTFLINNCPVCYGLGYYFDLVLDQSGSIGQTNGLNKVVQETVHLFESDEGTYSDYGYPEYGSQINKFVGSKNITQLRLKFQVLRDLQYINLIKEKQHQLFGNIDRSELIKQIVAIKTTNEVDTQSVELSLIVGDSDTLQFFNVKKFKV